MTDIADAARITYRMHEVVDGEIMQFGISTGRRDPSVWSDMLDRMDEAWTDSVADVCAGVRCDEIVYSEWDTAGFTGFHQRATKMVSHAGLSGSPLPPQIALNVSLVDDNDTDVPIRRRRGRFYLGLILQGWLDGDGRLGTTQRDAVIAAVGAIINSLTLTVPVSGLPDGACIASAAAGQLFPATRFGVGVGLDTQRRRRQKLVEGIVYTDL